MNPQIYDFILFRSTDIKDLQVCEAPPTSQPVHPNSMHYMDPAIVNYNQPHQYQQPAPQSYSTAPQKLQFGTGRSPAFEPVQPFQPAASPSIKFGTGPSFSSAAAPKLESVAPPKPMAPPKPVAPSAVHPEVARNIVSLTPKVDKKTESATSPKVMTYSTGTKKQEIVDDKGQFEAIRGSYASVASHGAKSQGRVSLERPGKFRAPSSTQAPAKYSSDFVFPQSNEAVKIKLDAAQEEVMRRISGGNFYEKSSFFDNISCDAKDGKEIEKTYTERSKNMETFGVAAPPSSYRGRGRGRGRGGHYHRGGGYRGKSQASTSH